jgi:hypothetical protein
MPLTITPPHYVAATATTTASYQFGVTGTVQDRDGIQWMHEGTEPMEEEELARALAQPDHVAWFTAWLMEFLAATAKHFSKPYGAQQVLRITQHQISRTSTKQRSTTIDTGSLTITSTRPDPNDGLYALRPYRVTFRGGKCEVDWDYQVIPMVIDIPDLESIDDSMDALGLEEVEDLPTADATEISQARWEARQRVKEARLKAKVALYRVQHQMALYQDRYGVSISDDSDEDTETDSEFEDEVHAL